jgi:hypothetical protein
MFIATSATFRAGAKIALLSGCNPTRRRSASATCGWISPYVLRCLLQPLRPGNRCRVRVSSGVLHPYIPATYRCNENPDLRYLPSAHSEIRSYLTLLQPYPPDTHPATGREFGDQNSVYRLQPSTPGNHLCNSNQRLGREMTTGGCNHPRRATTSATSLA